MLVCEKNSIENKRQKRFDYTKNCGRARGVYVKNSKKDMRSRCCGG
jgi:hypothetical protein